MSSQLSCMLLLLKVSLMYTLLFPVLVQSAQCSPKPQEISGEPGAI